MSHAQSAPAIPAQRSGLSLAKFTDANGNYGVAPFGVLRFGGDVVKATEYTVTILVDLVVDADGMIRSESNFLGRTFTFAKGDVRLGKIDNAGIVHSGTRTVWGAQWCDSCAGQGVWHG